jgi:hypothetical protein
MVSFVVAFPPESYMQSSYLPFLLHARLILLDLSIQIALGEEYRLRNYAGFEVVAPVVMKITIFWNITPCSPLKVNLCSGAIRCLHLQARRRSHARNQRESKWQAELFDPEDGGVVFLRNVG